MNRMQRAAVVVSLIKALKAKDSWCAETNVQKACFFRQELTGVPLDLEFVLYKYGPYSFALTDELTAMRADSILGLRVRDPKYGPCYVLGEFASPSLIAIRRQLGNVRTKFSSLLNSLEAREWPIWNGLQPPSTFGNKRGLLP